MRRTSHFRKMSVCPGLVALLASFLIAACGGPTEAEEPLPPGSGDEVEQSQSAATSCGGITYTCEPCSGGLYRIKTVKKVVVIAEVPYCDTIITYGSCQTSCAL